MKKLKVGIASVLMLVMIAACASLGVVQPQSFDQKVAYSNGVLTGVVNATATSLDAHQISSEDAKGVRNLAKEAAGFLDAARAAGNTPEGNSQLALATAVLTQLQTYLNDRSRK